MCARARFPDKQDAIRWLSLRVLRVLLPCVLQSWFPLFVDLTNPRVMWIIVCTERRPIGACRKTSDGRRPTSSELSDRRMSSGWDLHVVFVNGKSAIEVYKRSQGMTEQEFNRLMAIHAGGSFWKRLGKEDKTEVVSAFGFDMIRDDGLVRARKLGRDSVLFFDTEIDVELAEMKTSDLQEKAPVSVDGF